MSEAIEVINWVRVAALLGAGLCMGLGALGPALGQGFVGAKACESIAKKPESAGLIMRTMLVAIGIIESAAIYCFVIAILLILLG
ncbi:TPA: ATP synthase F0 subunit C [Candidatus Dependentiae bacterium]|nr:MAG: ATP synthase F0, C subunit [candidate division TM6 bacterium GW2011_GWE2_31_21]KKP53239.1 MAG: ATP synthase F0, C subunit [candidate division TM6 bacterium GW2011_GWF2_33_332]HBS48062.1 ATP synthase F0 subunit C [Candidatus Dependentiae bacterium]HBZ73335.1 ATP synthase F0 subunit C [Candidatus Dependentiae bacterium]